MATFYYRAVTSAGGWQEGTREGRSERAVARDLQTMGLAPVYVGLSPESGRGSHGPAWSRFGGMGLGGSRGHSSGAAQSLLAFWSGGRVTSRDRLLFTQELATLLNAGVPLDRALSICSELTENRALREILADVLRQVRAGKSLAEALEAQGKAFSRLYVNMVRAGQASGTLAAIFERLAQLEAAAAEWRSQLISSLIYPALLTAVAVASLAVLMNVVVPRFAQVFESTGLPIPLPTYLLLETSRLIQTYGWIALLAVIAGAILFRRALQTPAGRERWDRFLLRLPLVGDLLRRAETARFARTMATLVAGSVPLVQSLGLAKDVIGNRVMAASLDRVAQGVKRGEGIAAPVRQTGVFPPLAAHLLTVGEETGHLDTVFERLANIYDRETQTAVRRLTALFEPVVILGMGLMVGVIVLSLLMAITSINEVPL
jgi:general secretion pathway protein F